MHVLDSGYSYAVSSSLRVRHAPRYAALGRLLLKHRSAALERGPAAGSGIALEDGVELDAGHKAGEEASAADAEALVAELVRLGPTFVKLGQLLSTRSDVLPPVYLQALSSLREDVEPLPQGEAEQVVQEELGLRISKGFQSFEPSPFAAASLGQVHRATLRNGRVVAVKVQRPDARRQVLDDMDVISELASFVDEHSSVGARFGFVEMVEQFRRSLMSELDYRQEAANQRILGEKLVGYGRIVVPQPVEDYTTSRVLTMDYLDARSVSSIRPLGRVDLDFAGLGEELIGAYLDQVLVHGIFHADPHPGNVLLTGDDRLALVDLGMVSRVSTEVQGQLLRLLLAVSSGDGPAAAEALDLLGTRLQGYDGDRLKSEIGEVVRRYSGGTVGQIAAGRLLGHFAMISASCGLKVPAELTLLAKALLNLDEVARLLDPELQVEAIIKTHAARVMEHRMTEAASPTHLLRTALDTAAFVGALPGQLHKVLDSLSEGKFTLNVEGLDEPALLRGAQKLANRVAAGVLIAALVVAAALFSSNKTGTLVWGYPVLSIVFLGLAIIVSAWMGISILRRDLRQQSKRR